MVRNAQFPERTIAPWIVGLVFPPNSVHSIPSTTLPVSNPLDQIRVFASDALLRLGDEPRLVVERLVVRRGALVVVAVSVAVDVGVEVTVTVCDGAIVAVAVTV